MSRSKAARARVRARRALVYREWYVAPSTAAIPPMAILTDRRLQLREELRQLRRAQAGQFDTAPAVEPGRIAA